MHAEEMEILFLGMLADKKRENMTLDEQMILTNIKKTLATRASIAAGRSEVNMLNKSSRSMMKFTAVTASAALMLGFFGDDEDAAKASIIMMTISLIPAIAQMGIYSAEVMGMGAATMAAESATWGLSAALKSTGFLFLAGVLAAGLAYGLASLLPSVDRDIASVNNLNSALYTTREILRMTAAEFSETIVPPEWFSGLWYEEFGTVLPNLLNMSETQLEQSVTFAEGQMERLAKSQALYTEDDPLFAALDKDIQDLDKWLVAARILKQRVIAQGIGGMSNEEIVRAYLGGELGELAHTNMPRVLESAITDYVTLDPIRGLGSYQSREIELQPEYTTAQWLDDIDSGAATWEDFAHLFADGVSDIRFQSVVLLNSLGFTAEEIEDIFDDEALALAGLSEAFDGSAVAMANFANAREELFYGGRGSLMQGDFMKTVVTKGVENLYSNVELLMTNNFYGLTWQEAVDAIAAAVMEELEGITGGVHAT